MPSSLQSAARYILGLPRDILGERNPRPPAETDRAAGLKSLSGTVRKDAILNWTNLSPSASRFFISSRNAPLVGKLRDDTKGRCLNCSKAFVKPGRVRSFSVFFILDLSRGWGILKLPVCRRSVAGFACSQPPPSPSSHKQNRGERFFRVGGGGAAVHRLFFTMTALKIRNTYLNDDHYSSIGFRTGLILLSKAKIVILIVDLWD